jgi:hypothetical protein
MEDQSNLFEIETLQEWNGVTAALATSVPAATGGCNSCSNNDLKLA